MNPDVWFSSDLHFYHKRIQEFCPNTRLQGSIEEMNEAIIENHNNLVKPGDIYYHLGDFSFGTAVNTELILARMNGRKRFIRGNHDKVLTAGITDRYLDSYKDYDMIRHNGKKIVLFHFPIESFNEMHNGAYHFHGHLHGDDHHTCKIIKNRIDVGLDTRPEGDMKPYHIDELFAIIKTRDNKES